MLEGFQVAIYDISLIATEPVSFRQPAAATLRGALGAVLHDKDPAAYALLIGGQEGPGDSGVRPYVLAVQGREKKDYAPGEELAFRLVLVGRGQTCLAAIVQALVQLEESGLGSNRDRGGGRFYLSRVMTYAPDGASYVVFDRASGQFYDVAAPVGAGDLMRRAASLPEDRLTLHFLTPTRLLQQGRLLERPQFAQVVTHLAWRLHTLLQRFCGTEADLRPVVSAAESVATAASDLRMCLPSRYSARQGTRIPLHGFVGTLAVTGRLRPLLPLLVAGEWVHVGKGAAMGQGRYRLES